MVKGATCQGGAERAWAPGSAEPFAPAARDVECRMEYVNLGNTGLKVSRLCLGMMSYGSPQWREWVLDSSASRPFVRLAVERGINFFDTANAYSFGASEEVTGKLLAEFARREEVVIATKVFMAMSDRPNRRGLSRKHIMDSIEESLRRLGTDYVDLYQVHRFDPETPVEETMEALHDVVKRGYARYVGASSMYAWQFAKALFTAERRGWSRFVSMQNHYNLLYREEEREMIPLCVDQGVGIIPWSPLARGYLTRRPAALEATARGRLEDIARRLYEFGERDRIIDAVCDVAEQHGVKPAQVAIAWTLSKPYVTAPIIGATKLDHLEDAVAAMEVDLAPEELEFLEGPYRPRPVLGHS